ncbi:hypothetical protein [Xanthomonas oryzae]|nr:hypothetical protein [Xanthomonas oryzae]
MAAWHWAGLAISAEVLQLKVGANQERKYPMLQNILERQIARVSDW